MNTTEAANSVKFTTKGQVVIPLRLRKQFHIEEGPRALVEATAFGALTIINRFEEYGVKIKQIVNCGGIAEKSPLVMQIYADVTGRPMKVSRSAQTCALGSAIARIGHRAGKGNAPQRLKLARRRLREQPHFPMPGVISQRDRRPIIRAYAAGR